MKVVALVSGGKDSCYAMMRCRDFGHEVVALANLMPLEDSVDELNSYMFQTVGHQIIISYAECMGVPLFRRRIRGSSRHQHLNYLVTSGDEVEDMFVLLNEVKNRIPSITAVSSGAIASDYQRLRVESVCSRLGLVSLAYLWRQDQTSLLEEMIRRDIRAIIVKVAAIGLKPSEHLGKEISEMKPHLHKLKEMYGINVCGEGGEYETLTLDCPLFKNARIILDDFKIVLHSKDSIASVGILHPLSFHLKYKEQSGKPDIFEVTGDYVTESSPVPGSLSINGNEVFVSRTTGTTFSMSSWVRNSSCTPEGLKEDLASILGALERELNKEGLSWAHVLYIHLYISNMDEFSLANEVYLKFITEKKCHLGVPSRSTIELPLGKVNRGNAHVELLVSGIQSKRVLHVQSISCWAPSCIGPYSQATLDREVLYMAGQLGLDPPTMALCSGGPKVEIDQALKNCEAVADAFNVSLSSSAILLVIYCSLRLTISERMEVQMKVEAVMKDCVLSPVYLYVLAPDLPKRALVEVKPILHIPEERETGYESKDQEASLITIPQSWDFSHSSMDESCCQKWIMPGKLCTVLISLSKDLITRLCPEQDKAPSSSHLSLPKKHLETASRFSFYLLHKILLENQFSWGDIISLRFYFSSELSTEAEELELTLFHTLCELTSSFDATIFSIIPVLSCGRSSSMDDLISCELFASKL